MPNDELAVDNDEDEAEDASSIPNMEAMLREISIFSTMMSLPDFAGESIGRYRLLSTLSAGTTGAVYCAIDAEFHEKYAVKCIPCSELTPKQLLLRTSEVFHHQLVTGCSSHVLPLQEIICDDVYLFIVSKLCEGDLHQAIWDHRIYQRNDALIKETFLDILDGVYECHKQGVFHRDLKPENILCGQGGTDIRIADFGLATRKRICRGSYCGTTNYMSPEQSSGDHIVYYPSLSDIWSLGIILINLVTGHCPWKFAHPSDIHFRAFLEDENYLFDTFPISGSLNRLLRWILCPNPIYRPRILQIRQAILNIDRLYRVPRTYQSTSIEWSKRMAMIQEAQVHDDADSDGWPYGNKKRVKQSEEAC